MQTQTQHIGDAIDRLATKLSVPVEHLWAVLIKQGRFEAFAEWVWMLGWLAAAVVIVYTARRIFRLFQDEQDEYRTELAAYRERQESSDSRYECWPQSPDDHTEVEFWVRLIRFALIGICLASALSDAINGARYFINPEVYALREVLSVLK